MNPTTIQICLSFIVLIFCVIPAIRIGFANLRTRKFQSTSGSFHKTLKKINLYDSEVPIEIDGAIMGDAKISNEILDLAIDEMASVLVNEDTKWGRCLIQKTSVPDIHGTPTPAISWILEPTEFPVIWRGQTDQNGSVVEIYKLDETETQMRFATTKDNEALQVSTDYAYHQSTR